MIPYWLETAGAVVSTVGVAQFALPFDLVVCFENAQKDRRFSRVEVGILYVY